MSGSNYTPKPISTESVEIPESLRPLLEQLAENVHDLWAKQRIADGWTFGPTRDDAAKKHPCLVPYPALPESEKVYDREVVAGTVKAMLALGWSISK
jgi:ryanodine receptor 2